MLAQHVCSGISRLKVMTDKTETQIQSLGGKARAKKLSKEDRSSIAKGAAEARWEKAGNRERLPVATHGSPDHPLCIGDLQIPFYVLDNGMRVLSIATKMKTIK